MKGKNVAAWHCRCKMSHLLHIYYSVVVYTMTRKFKKNIKKYCTGNTGANIIKGLPQNQRDP